MKNDQIIQEVLRTLEEAQKSRHVSFWNISPETGIFLQTILLAKQAKRVLEIGTSNGYSGLWIADALRQTGGALVTIESHAGRFAEAQKNFTAASVTDIVTQVKGHAPEILPDIAGTFDTIFFDATKEEHVSYVKTLEDRLEQYGVIITDNIISHKTKLAPYIAYMNEQPIFQNSIVPIGTGLMLSVKKK